MQPQSPPFRHIEEDRWNTLIDKFHVIPALPYVDEIISEDHFFESVYPATVKTGYVKARLVPNTKFLERFR
jgi:hypothetical protein